MNLSRHTPATRRRFLWSMVGAAAGVLGAGRAAAAALKAGERPKPIALGDLSGTRVVLPDAYTGKVLLLHFWATWCPPCRREMDALQSLFVEHRERGLAPVSVNVGEAKAAVAEFLRRRSVTYPVLLDADSSAARLYGVVGLPTTFLLDRRGAVAVKVIGEIDRDGLRRILSGAL